MEPEQAKKMQHELSRISASCKKYEMCYKRSQKAYGFWRNTKLSFRENSKREKFA